MSNNDRKTATYGGVALALLLVTWITAPRVVTPTPSPPRSWCTVSPAFTAGVSRRPTPAGRGGSQPRSTSTAPSWPGSPTTV